MKILQKQKTLDSLRHKEKKDEYLDWPLVNFLKKRNTDKPILFSSFGRTTNFSTKSLDVHFIKNDKAISFSSLDGFLRFEEKIPVRLAIKNRQEILEKIKNDFGSLKKYLEEAAKNSFQEMSMVKAWNISIVTSVIFGMFLMTSIYRYLGQDAAAKSKAKDNKEISQVDKNKKVLGSETKKKKESTGHVSDIENEYKKEKENGQEMEEKIEEMVKGYPIEKMASQIAKKDKVVAAFLISIAKKESNWGKRVPVLDGEDCYNYWGYRGIRKKMGSGGHTCFDSYKDAVNTVADRIEEIVKEEGVKTPEEIVTIWKCGYDCSWDNPVAVRKWVSDVKGYFNELMED